jgi:hypothetical protein
MTVIETLLAAEALKRVDPRVDLVSAIREARVAEQESDRKLLRNTEDAIESSLLTLKACDAFDEWCIAQSGRRAAPAEPYAPGAWSRAFGDLRRQPCVDP